MKQNEIIILILVASIATIITRFLPFIIFNKKEKYSRLFELFEKVMPFMIMIALVFYTLKEIKLLEFPYGFSEIISIFLTIFLHVKYKNIFFSIFISTLFYMALVQYIVPVLINYINIYLV